MTVFSDGILSEHAMSLSISDWINANTLRYVLLISFLILFSSVTNFKQKRMKAPEKNPNRKEQN